MLDVIGRDSLRRKGGGVSRDEILGNENQRIDEKGGRRRM